MKIFILFFTCSALWAVTPGELETYSTIHSIGVEWDVSNDDNNDAVCDVQFRVQGNLNWKNAHPLFRVHFTNDESEINDMLAGSIMFLEPGTTYEVKLDMTDPDGGASNCVKIVSTRSVPVLPASGNDYHVVPGNGGGSGTSADPFQGINAAQAIASPGDIFLLHSGNYGNGSRVLFDVSGSQNNYIVWKNEDDEKPAFVNGVRISGDYVWLQGLKIIDNNGYGLLTQSGYEPDGVVVTRNFFTNCHYSIQINHGGKNWYITDNIIVGDTLPSSGSFSGEGVELEHTSGHVVAYNKISYVADGVSYPNKNCDIYNNEIFDVSDDGIEPDYGYANNRVWKNRISNAGNNGISFQPMNSAPWYIIRNQVAAPAEDALKLRSIVDRALIANNTFVCWSGVQANDADFLLSFKTRNNLWISIQDRYVWENGSGGAANWKTDLDYDGFDWGNYVFAFKWGSNKKYSNLADFQTATGLEPNAIHVEKNLIFENFDVPAAPPASIPFQYMTLKSGCNAINAGVALPNIIDDFNGTAPDLGAYELGTDLPHYGPRDIIPEPFLFINCYLLFIIYYRRRKF